jgi:hypothetical protein
MGAVPSPGGGPGAGPGDGPCEGGSEGPGEGGGGQLGCGADGGQRGCSLVPASPGEPSELGASVIAQAAADLGSLGGKLGGTFQ